MTSSKTPISFKVSRRFRRLTLNTVIALFCLIVAGGVVRSTGAGMGCPDWPKCFGSWVPPTEVSQLPLNYKEIYGAKLKGEVEFNPVKTWIEYVNRLIGAFTGVLIFLTLLASIPYLKNGKRSVFYYSLLAFVLVGVQGWLGSKVVSTELMPVMITMHMFLAIVIVLILLYLFAWSGKWSVKEDGRVNGSGAVYRVTMVAMVLSLIQILLGTQVREAMDEVIHLLGYEARDFWIEQLGIQFYIHRSFSILVAAVNVLWFWLAVREKMPAIIVKLVGWSVSIVAVEVLTGILMAYFGVPAYAQPIHLTLAIGMIGLQFVVWLLINERRYLRDLEVVKGEMV